MGQGWPERIGSHYCVWVCFCSCLCLCVGKPILEILYCPGVSSRCSNPKKRCRFILKCTKLRLETCSQKCFSFWNFETIVVFFFAWQLCCQVEVHLPQLFSKEDCCLKAVCFGFIWTMGPPASVSELRKPLICFLFMCFQLLAPGPEVPENDDVLHGAFHQHVHTCHP